MDKELQQKIFSVMNEALPISYEVEKLQSYSGRGMYGQKCVGLVLGDISQFAVFCARAGILAREADQESQYTEDDQESQYTEDDLSKILRNTREDSMGRSTIYYWPTLWWKAEYE